MNQNDNASDHFKNNSELQFRLFTKSCPGFLRHMNVQASSIRGNRPVPLAMQVPNLACSTVNGKEDHRSEGKRTIVDTYKLLNLSAGLCKVR